MRRILILICIFLAACESRPAGPAAEDPSQEAAVMVIASNYPLYYFTRQIAGDSSGISVRLPEMSGDPSNWKPNSSAIGELQNADLVVLNGAAYESWLTWITVHESRLLDTSASFSDSLIPLQEETIHQHGPAGEHSHQGVAFTVWLDPSLAIKQAQSIKDALVRLAPEQESRFLSNLSGLTTRLHDLDRDQEQAFAQFSGQKLIFSHPVYQYLQARYGLNGASVHWEPQESPATKAWIELNELLRRHPATLMLWEDVPLVDSVQRLRQSGIRSVTFQTAANRPESGDYFDVMQSNLERLEELSTKP